MRRRTFRNDATVGAGGLVAGRLLGATTRSGSDRPNVLFIWTDQQTATALSCAGNPWVKTPAMDLLAARGVWFTQTFCTNPICVLSRTSWLTGRMPHETGVQFNTERRPVDGPALPRRMREAGCATGYVGKWHIPRDGDDVSRHGLDFRRAVHGSRIDGVINAAGFEFLDRPRENAPFFLTASFLNPHDICEWARQEAGMRSPMPNGDLPAAPPVEDCSPMPSNFTVPAGEPEVVRALAAAAPRIYPTQEWTGDTWRRYLWAYFRLVEQVDRQIGELLAGLWAWGLEETTLIIFASDHGDGAAAHEMTVAQSEPAPDYGRPGGVMGRMATDGRWKYIRYSHGHDAEQLFDRSIPGR